MSASSGREDGGADRELPGETPPRANDDLPSPKRLFLLGATPSLEGRPLPAAQPGVSTDLSAAKLELTGGNTGNQVIAYGLLRTLSYDNVNWDYSIGPKRVNEEYDAIVIAAANFIHTGFDLSGMANFIEATELPCVMIGVGAQSNNYSTDIPLKPGTERLMRIVAERSKLIGARGPFTADVLSAMGIKNVQVTGCPSFYMSAKRDLSFRKPALTAASRLMINSSRDVVGHSFEREKMINLICQLVSVAIARHADFAPQSELPELRIADTTDAAEKERNFDLILGGFPFFDRLNSRDELFDWFSHHTRAFWDVEVWIDEMRKYDFVFGNRFHGAMAALQAGTAACVICHDTRTAEMCDFLGVPAVSITDIDHIDVDELYETVDPVAFQGIYNRRYGEYKDFLMRNSLPTTLE